MKKFFQNLVNKNFKSYWKHARESEKFDKELKYISDYFINSKSYNFVSKQWQILNILDYKSIAKNGLDNYGSDISTHYFTFMEFTSDHLRNLFENIENNSLLNLKSNILKKQKNFDYKTSINYNLLCLLLFENLKKKSSFNFLNHLKDETYIGNNHPYINIDSYKISSDKIVSIFDYDLIDSFFKLNKSKFILEIGAGSGRLSECILTLNPNIKFIVCDIPPSLYISYKRLKTAFPQKKINILINKDGIDLEKEVEKSDISFIFPHQLDSFRKNFFDLVLAVDCFHEMDKKTHSIYYKYITKITEFFYFSIWSKTKNWHSGNFFKKTERLDYDKGDYNIPNNWKNVYRKNLIFPANQLGLGFKILK